MEYIQLIDDSDLPGIAHCAPFKAILAIEEAVSRNRQIEISNWLVEMGAKYVMICGTDCQSWEESIRRANLNQVDLEHMKPEEFVMITSHPNERLRSVFWHAKKHARHTHVKIVHTVIIHVGRQNRSVDYLSMYEKA